VLNISWEIEYLDMILCHSPNKVFKIVSHDHGFFPNLWSVWVGDHPQEDLAKFGYKWKRTVGKLGFHVLFVHMLEVWTYCLNNDNFIIVFLILWQLGSIFSKKTHLYHSHLNFFCCHNVKICPQTRKHSWQFGGH